VRVAAVEAGPLPAKRGLVAQLHASRIT
jgi:hypothetical protein